MDFMRRSAPKATPTKVFKHKHAEVSLYVDAVTQLPMTCNDGRLLCRLHLPATGRRAPAATRRDRGLPENLQRFAPHPPHAPRRPEVVKGFSSKCAAAHPLGVILSEVSPGAMLAM